MARRAVSRASLGAWLVKASPDLFALSEVARSGFETVTHRCVRPSYRADLIGAGQPVLLWISGRDQLHPAGLYAAGWTTGPVETRDPELRMPVRLTLIDPVVTREEILAHPVLSGLEVIRMPAGSNPSYLDTEQYRALLSDFPQVSPR